MSIELSCQSSMWGEDGAARGDVDGDIDGGNTVRGDEARGDDADCGDSGDSGENGDSGDSGGAKRSSVTGSSTPSPGNDSFLSMQSFFLLVFWSALLTPLSHVPAALSRSAMRLDIVSTCSRRVSFSISNDLTYAMRLTRALCAEIRFRSFLFVIVPLGLGGGSWGVSGTVDTMLTFTSSCFTSICLHKARISLSLKTWMLLHCMVCGKSVSCLAGIF
jgi:hypothetical protein